jgi:Ca2+-binding RTX toxin-like protein
MNVDGTEGSDHLVGGSDNDFITGYGGDDILEGMAGQDGLWGGVGNDHLYGGAGADLLDGGADFDLARYEKSSAGVIVDLTANTGSGGDAQGDTFIAIEGIVGSNFSDVLTGNNLGNILYGLGGDDVLYGVSDDVSQSGGPDALYGGDGNDHLFLSLATQIVDGGAGYDVARYDYFSHGVYVSTSTLTSIEALVGSSWNDSLFGDAGDNVLYGQDGDDLLAGRGGADSLYGGDGNDRFQGDSSQGLLDGGAGLDMVLYENSTAGVIVDLALHLGSGGDAAGDTYASIEAVGGSNLADTLIGDEADNILYGQGGDDVVRGGGGANRLYGGDGSDHLYAGTGPDLIDGGAGYDLVRYDQASAGVLVNLPQGGGDGAAAGDVYIAVEGVVGSRFNDTIIGDARGNALYGLDGDDVLFGEGGNDLIEGGAGNDHLYISGGIDVLNGGEGFDFVRYDFAEPNHGPFSGHFVDLKAEGFISIEGLVGSMDMDYLLGTDGTNIIYGGASDDIIEGRGGDDKLYGDTGDDLFKFLNGSGVDQIMDFNAIGAFHDQIGILTNVNGSGIVDYATLLPHIQESMMAGITIDLGGGAMVSVPNLHLADVRADLFFFHD